MYSDKVRKRTILILCVLLLLVLAAGLAAWALHAGSRNLQEEGAAALQETIRRNARQCYVVEGIYPPDLQYLEDNYGLQINQKDYYVTYEAFAENLPPNVRVTAKK